MSSSCVDGCRPRRRISTHPSISPTVTRPPTGLAILWRSSWSAPAIPTCCPGPAATAEECVSVEDWSRVSRDLSAVLDVEDVIPVAYTLEVSSPGLDRPLRGRTDFERFSGRRVKVVIREAVDGQTFFKGRL